MAKLHGVKYKEGVLKSKISGGKAITTQANKLVFDTKETDQWLLDNGTIGVTPVKGNLLVVCGHNLAKRLIAHNQTGEVKCRLVSGYSLAQAKEGEPVTADEMPNIVNKLENQWKGGNGHARVRRVGERTRF